MAETPNELAPADLTLDEDGNLIVNWTDGQQSRLSSRRLRLGCPCAMCREQQLSGASLRVEQEPSPGSYTIRRFERVGRYAVSVIWGDGHSTGIYSWPILRKLCDCFQCRMEGEQGCSIPHG